MFLQVLTDLNTLSAIAVAPFVGSFLANVVTRLPKGESIVHGRSKCPTCNTVLRPYDLIPIFSWIMLRGRCRHCRTGISPIYPAIEFIAFIVVCWAATRVAGVYLWTSCILGWALLVLAIIDLQTYQLLDILTLPLILAGWLVALIIDPSILPDHLIGAVAGIVSFAIISRLYQRFRGREGLGLGDAKLAGAAGAWTSWTGLPGVILWACASALGMLLWRSLRGDTITLKTKLPFGPHLCLGIWLVWLYGPIEFSRGV